MTPMPGFKLPTTFNNPNLTVGRTLTEALLADANVLRWWRADPQFATAEGTNNDQVITLTDRKAGGVFTRFSSVTSPQMAANAFGAWPGLRFNAAESDRMLYTGPALDLTQPHSWFVIFKPADSAVAENILGSFTSSTVGDILNMPTGGNSLRYKVGTGNTATIALTIGAVTAALTHFDGTHIQLDVNGVLTPVVSPGTPTPGSAQIALGGLSATSQLVNMDFAELIYLGRAMLDGADASAGTLELLRELAGMYGQTV